MSLRHVSGVEQLYQARRMIGGIENMLFSTYLKLENGKDPVVTLVNLSGQVITLRGPILVSRKIGDEA